MLLGGLRVPLQVAWALRLAPCALDLDRLTGCLVLLVVVLSGFLGKDAARCGVWCVVCGVRCAVCGVASFLVLEVGSWDCVDDFTCDKSDV